jgi:hypothetical protein
LKGERVPRGVLALVLVAIAAVAAATSGAAAVRQTAGSVYFRGEGGNVVCGAFSVSGAPNLLECGTLAQLSPVPPRPRAGCRGLDFAGNRIRLAATGRPFGFCSGDVGVLAQIHRAARLAYGASRHMGPFTCTASVAWLSCRNKTGHGFALSRNRWHPI